MANEQNPDIASLESQLGLNAPAAPAQASQPVAKASAQKQEPGFLSKVGSVAKTAASVFVPGAGAVSQDMADRQANFYIGAMDVVQDIGNGVIDVADATANWAEGKGFKDTNDLPNITFTEDTFGKPLTESEKNGRAVGRFATQLATFVGGGLTASALKASKYIQGAAAIGTAATTNFLAFDPKEDQMNGLAREIPILKEILPDFLNAKPEDTEMDLRFKNAMNGVLDDAVLAGAFSGIAKLYKKARGVKQVIDTPALGSAIGSEFKEPAVSATASSGVKAAVSTEPKVGAKVVTPPPPVGRDLPPANVVSPAKLLEASPTGENVINVSRLSGQQDITSAIKTIASENPDMLKAASRGVIPDDEVNALAREILADPAKMKSNGLAKTAEEIQASRIFLNASAKDTIEKAKKYAATGSEEDLMSYMASFGNTNKAMAEVSGTAAETGRALRAFRGNPAEMTMDEIKILQDQIKMTGSPAEIRQSAQQIAEAVASNPKNALQIMARMSKDTVTKRISDAAFGVWYSSMLSNPMTHVKNFVSNTVVQAAGVATRYGAWAIGGGKNVAREEADALLSNSMDSFFEGIQGIWNKESRASFAAKSMKQSSGKLAVSQDAFRLISKDGNMMTKALAAPLEALQKSDEFFKTVAYSSQTKALAIRSAKSEGLAGAEMLRRAEEIAGEVKAGVDETHQFYGIHKQATDYAKQMTFTQQLPEGWMSNVSDLMDSLPMKTGKLIAPFTKVSLNMVDWAITHNPLLAPMSRRWREEIAKGGASKDLALSKVAMGGLFTSMGAGLAYMGLTNGSEPESKTARNASKAAGVKYNSITMGNGASFSLDQLGPVGDIIRMGADIHELSGYLTQDKTDELAALSSFIGSQIADSVAPDFITEGVFEVISAVRDSDENKLKAFAAGLGRSTVPGIARFAKRNLPDALGGDSIKRSTRGDTGYKQWSDVWQQTVREWKANIPGLGKDLPPQRNLFGEAITYAPGHGPENMSAIAYTTNPKDTAAFEEIARLGLSSSFMKEDLPEGETELRIDLPRRSFSQNGVKLDLNPEQYDRFVQLSAGIGLGTLDPNTPPEKRPVSRVGTLRDSLTSLVKSGYKDASGLGKMGTIPGDGRYHTDQNKRVAISKVVRAYREMAKSQLFSEFPELRGNMVKGIESKLKAKNSQFQGLGR